ncbi:MAG TPA: hypothetical protein VJ276_16710 [Thermoanaerobaculia bacterium]|nr:hypothetical protein [Thermoanaerobaculia bacterium]
MTGDIDYEVVARLAEAASEVLVVRAFGAAGGESLRLVVESVRRLYHSFDPSYCSGSLVVFNVVDPHQRIARDTVDISDASLQRDLRGGAIIEVSHDGSMRRLTNVAVTAEELSATAVVYEFNAGEERFYANYSNRTVQKVVQGSESSFAMPAFLNVKDALQVYAEKFVRRGQCRILTPEAWYDERRWWLRAKPEKTMRRSLEQFLRARLRAQVMPEQNVDESHPVDIRVAFDLPRRLALIEIKWMGQSRQSDGAMATPYFESRARDGAEQLANYMDSQRTFTPDVALRGYLVVIDARRRGVQDDTATLSHEDGFHFAEADITFDPEYHKTRYDFEAPVRMFVEPVCD